MPPIPVVRITDCKPGHLAQSAGLVAALARRTSISVREQHAMAPVAALLHLVRGQTASGPATGAAEDALANLQRPLIICCGHGTHLTGLALRRALGGRLVVLMRPSLPIRCFDLVIAPRHDGLAASDRVLLTEGVLNPLTAAGAHHADRGLILIGGPSKHHGWDGAGLIEQLRSVTASAPQMRWTLTTSRRTPAETTRALASLNLTGIEVVPMEQTGPGWVAAQLAEASTAWITEDSVSMVYEALTAGVAVGLLGVPAKGASRVVRGVDELVAEGRVSRLPGRHLGHQPAHLAPLAEADRIASEIIRRWYPSCAPAKDPL